MKEEITDHNQLSLCVSGISVGISVIVRFPSSSQFGFFCLLKPDASPFMYNVHCTQMVTNIINRNEFDFDYYFYYSFG